MKTATDTSITLNESIRRKVHALQTMVQKIVHDTNNYYGILQGYLSLLGANLADDENLRKFLSPMEEALRTGIALNKRLAEYYRASQVMLVDVDLAAVVGEACSAFAREHDFAVDLSVASDLEPLLLEETAVRSLVANLCLLAKETKTSPACLELAPIELEEKDIAAMVLDSQPGPYVRLQTTVSLAGYSQEEETEFLNPFAISIDHAKDLGLALLFSTLLNNGGNLDVAIQDQCITLAIYFPRR